MHQPLLSNIQVCMLLLPMRCKGSAARRALTAVDTGDAFELAVTTDEESVTHHWSQGGLGWSVGWLALMVCPALATADEVSCQALGLTSC